MAGAEHTSDPFDHTEIDLLFAGLKDFGHLALAVSGGSDSVALMVLAALWHERHRCAPGLSVLTVDHGLRDASADEALQVARWAARLGLPHATLVWQGDKPDAGVQDSARDARYNLMTAWCKQNGAEAIVTGHTRDDQAETVLMRLARGSGVDGLSGMAATSEGRWRVLRPLLSVPRARLRAHLEATGQVWIEDPSNEDVAFERIRVRKALDQHVLGLEVDAVALSARRMARARAALEHYSRRLADKAVSRDDSGKVLIDLACYLEAPEDMQVRLLQDIIKREGGQDFGRMAAIERLADWIKSGAGRARTLGGCRISRRKRFVVIAVEPGRQR